MLVVAAVVTVPFAVASNTSILWPGAYTGEEAALVAHLRTLPVGRASSSATSPGLVWRSGHDTPGDFADTSYQRLDEGSITQASLVKAASVDDVCGVIVTSPTHFGRLGGLPDALAAHDYHPVQFGDHITLYERDTGFCAPLTQRERAAAGTERSNHRRGGRRRSRVRTTPAPPRR